MAKYILALQELVLRQYQQQMT